MKSIVPLKAVTAEDRSRVGGKAFALSVLARSQFPVPDGLCVSTRAYEVFVREHGLRQRIALEMGRKPFAQMRWEEIWDVSLRIRNLFAGCPLPPDLRTALADPLEEHFAHRRVSVRSSAPGEDSGTTSFAGLHDSFVNVQGVQNMLERIKLVWASLWSDRALMYRKELGLDPSQSVMAVVIQDMVAGECSGITFGKNPNDASQAVIESVHGLNQGLVDGTVEPDRWLVDRASGRVVAHHPASARDSIMIPSPGGVRLADCPPEQREVPPLDASGLRRVFDLAMQAESQFGRPQDMEWTFQNNELLLLQSRPITTLTHAAEGDQRPWYLSLQRSFDNLQHLRSRIESERLPDMEREAAGLAGTVLASLDDAGLAWEIDLRRETYQHWSAIYREEFIPMAHGMRLFGQVYNDTVRPDDPYEFMRLLGDTRLMSLRRNRWLEELAAMIREDAELAADIQTGRPLRHRGFEQKLEDFMAAFGNLTCGAGQCGQGRASMLTFLQEVAAREPRAASSATRPEASLESAYFQSFSPEQRDFAGELLDLGRASYRLRDDDNLYLGRIKQQLLRGLEEAEARGPGASGFDPALREAAAQGRALLAAESAGQPTAPQSRDVAEVTARQLVGQPAGPGLARGRARVVFGETDLMAFKAGEILVCDAVDPNMTFVVPLAAGIVERRGGMLIHGAIIAREYGLACVTGISGATQFIATGDQITVDGYLGLVILDSAAAEDRLAVHTWMQEPG